MKINYKYLIIIAVLFICQFTYSQQQVVMKSSYGSGNQEIDDLMFFEQIGLVKLVFESNELKGKHIEVTLKEFKNGKLKTTKKLFDGEGYDFFKIDSSYTFIKFYFKYHKSSMDIFIKTPYFASLKQSFKLYNTNEEYVLKDFLGSKNEEQVPLDEGFPVLAIITPHKQKDGLSSYCEVAQSGVEPSQLGTKFNIPHYFVIYMKFK